MIDPDTLFEDVPDEVQYAYDVWRQAVIQADIAQKLLVLSADNYLLAVQKAQSG